MIPEASLSKVCPTSPFSVVVVRHFTFDGRHSHPSPDRSYSTDDDLFAAFPGCRQQLGRQCQHGLREILEDRRWNELQRISCSDWGFMGGVMAHDALCIVNALNESEA